MYHVEDFKNAENCGTMRSRARGWGGVGRRTVDDDNSSAECRRCVILYQVVGFPCETSLLWYE